MSTSTDSIKAEKSRKGKARHTPSAGAAMPEDREGRDRKSSANEPAPSAKQRSWGEKHGGTIVIGIAFTLIALLALVKTVFP